VEELRRDEKWFAKACDAIVEYWRYKNSRKGQNPQEKQRQPHQDANSPEFAETEN